MFKYINSFIYYNLFPHILSSEFIAILLRWVMGTITQIITYNEKGLFYEMYKDVLTEVYC